MYKTSIFEVPRAALLCVGATLLVAASSARAQEGGQPAATSKGVTPALVAPEPVLQLVQDQVGIDESIVREPQFPSETRRRIYPNRPLLATGTTVFGLSYLPSVIGAAAADGDNDNTDDLYIPVAGPWMMLARGPEEEGWEKTLLVLSGVGQGLGALMLVSSFFIPQRVTERWYLIGSKGNVRVAPTRVATGYGLGAAGRF